MAQSDGKYQTLVITGDFNMKDLKWDQGIIQIDTSLSDQAENLFIFMNDHFLNNYVTKPTREGNLLDLVMTNDHFLVTHVDHCQNSKFR